MPNHKGKRESKRVYSLALVLLKSKRVDYFNVGRRQKQLSFLLQEIHVLVKHNCEPIEIAY